MKKALLLIMAFVAVETHAGEILKLNLRSRQTNQTGEIEITTKAVQWPAAKTAIVVCDMWDDHWCKSASARVAELAGPMNAMLKKARGEGVFIIHAPSTTVGFYQNSPARRLALEAPFSKSKVPLSTAERWGTTWCWPDKSREIDLPIDDSDMGCDCQTKCTIRDAWKRQIAAIDIMDGDAITDHGQETVNLLEHRKIENVILVGVHLNMCVLGRPFGIRQMVNIGKNVALMRDMVDTMYNPEKSPKVDHFRGTDLVVAHVERYWCPSFESTDITGKPAFRFAADQRVTKPK